MAKSIKLKNNMYWDSTSIKHNKKNLSDILDKNIMKIIYSGDYYNLTTNNTYELVNLNNTNFSIGNKLTFDSTNKAIKIGEGVSKVKIHAELSIVKKSAGLIYLQIRSSSGVKRGWNVYAQANSRTKAIGDEYINVAKDDLIQMFTYGSTTDEITGGSGFTSLVVEVIE